MKVALSTDHAGFEQLQKLQQLLAAAGHECVNFGPQVLDTTDDYPDFIFPAARAVAAGECEAGIIWGGSGQGEAIAANRIRGVRCAVYYSSASAKEAIDADGTAAADNFEILRLSRQHNHANMLSLGARFLTFDEARQAIMIWLQTPYSEAERHVRRIKKLDA